jgi:hypothetical protein
MTRVITVPASPRIRNNKAPQRRNIMAVRSQKRSSPKSSSMLDTSAFAALLFCSGVAAMVYQVLWIKQLCNRRTEDDGNVSAHTSIVSSGSRSLD